MSETRSRNGTLAEAIAILKRANLHSWYPGKQELWVGWQNCESMKMDPMQQVIDMLESIAAPSETVERICPDCGVRIEPHRVPQGNGVLDA